MLAFILRRLLQSIAVLLTVGLVAFSLFRYVGDPINAMVGQDTTMEQRDELRTKLGLNDSAPIQFARFIYNASRGNFGLSYRTSEPVGRLIVERMPATLELSLCAALFVLFIGVPMGVYTGLYPKHWSSRLLQAVSLIGISLPTFLIGILLILVFAVSLHWLPSFGRGETVQIGWWTTNFLTWSGLKALILPSITLGLFQLALIAFAIVTETVFAWPGVGQLFIQSVQFSDIPVMAAYLLLIGLLFVLINLVVDLLYFAVDPRLRAEGGGARVAGH